jgi:hypothetical protein
MDPYFLDLGTSWSGELDAPAALPPVLISIGGWVDPRADLDEMKKRQFFILPGLELRPLGRPARSQSLYPLRYPGSLEEIGVDVRILLKWMLKLGWGSTAQNRAQCWALANAVPDSGT